MKVELVWITPDAENLIVKMARVSNPASAEAGQNNDRLIRYLIRNKHWSPFEMVNACFRIETTRDIARQLLRHRSFTFQEFSQRYADVSVLPKLSFRQARAQDPKNRQNSLPMENEAIAATWEAVQRSVYDNAIAAYRWALDAGIAKEVARAILPEGLTPSALYMNGTIRSWIHYTQLRTGNGTQREHMEIAKAIESALAKECPTIWRSLKNES